MKKNVGSADKVVRLLIAVLMSVLYFTGIASGTIGYLALAVGGVMLLTAVVGTCPLYGIVGINTCKRK